MQTQVITRNNLGEGFVIDPSTKTISVAKRTDLGTFTMDDYILSRWNKDRIYVPDGATAVPANEFAGFTDTAIYIPDGVVSIGDGAFKNCTNATSVRLPDSLTSIGADAFSGCTNISEVLLPQNFTTMGSNAFAGMTALRTLQSPTWVTFYEIFKQNNGITEVRLTTTVDEIANAVDEYHSQTNRLTNTVLKTTPEVKAWIDRVLAGENVYNDAGKTYWANQNLKYFKSITTL